MEIARQAVERARDEMVGGVISAELEGAVDGETRGESSESWIRMGPSVQQQSTWVFETSCLSSGF